MFCLRFGRHGSIIEQHGHHVTCALIGTSHKLAAYNYVSSLALEQRLSTSWWVVGVEPATRSVVATWN